MSDVKSAAERYWVIYYLVYLGAAGAGLWYYWPRLLWYWRQPLLHNDSIYLLAAIFGTAVGIALAVAIILEVSGRMVLLIPAAVRKIKAQRREEGLVEGRQEGVVKERQRIGQALTELGLHEGNGAQVILDADAGRRILSDDAPGKS